MWVADESGELCESPIIGIAAGPRVDTYDLSVHEHHEFVAGGLLVHNSYPEYVIPTDPAYRQRATQLHAALAADLGVAPMGAAAPMMAAGGVMPLLADGGILGTVGGWLGDAANWVGHAVSSAYNAVTGALGDVTQWIGGGIDAIKPQIEAAIESMLPGGFLKGAGKWIVDQAIPALEQMISQATAAGAGVMTPVGAAGAGVQRWAGTALQALAMEGQPASMLGLLLHQMQTESSGDPNIVNTWDINAQEGHPSAGLMQVIWPTFETWRDPRLPNNLLDPLANIAASIRYTVGTYGSLPAGWHGHGYDTGGMLPPGVSLAFNGTGSGEHAGILTTAQWAALQSTAAQAEQTGTVGGPRDVGPAIAAALNGLRIEGRLEIGADGFGELVDGRIRVATSSLASAVTAGVT